MWQTLLNFAKSFLSGRLTASVFSEAYIELWRIERDNDPLLYPAELREEPEFDEDRLRAKVARWVQKVCGLE